MRTYNAGQTIPTNLDPLFLAWAAGFVDGEGHLALIRFKNENTGPRAAPFKWKARLTVVQNDRRPLDELRKTFGVGTVRERRPGHYAWEVSTAQARQVAAVLRPYLRVKAEAADEVINQEVASASSN